MSVTGTREGAYGQSRQPTPVDRFGVWLGTLAVKRNANFAGARFADLGCGFHAKLSAAQLDFAQSATLVDVALSDELKAHPKVTAIEGTLPASLTEIPSGSLDIVLCLSVLEHLWEPQETLGHIHRLLAPGGVAILNVPSWLGKTALEFAAFRLGVSPAEEMDDHKAYYDPSDFWPMLVKAGFRPSNIRCHRHKFGLNTSAVARVDK